MRNVVISTQEEKLKLVYDCLTTGLPTLAMCGFRLDYSHDEYKAAHDSLAERMDPKYICIEDVQAEMLRRGNAITFVDTENDGEFTTALDLNKIESNWDKLPSRDVNDYMAEAWDSITAENMMQSLLFGEVVFG